MKRASRKKKTLHAVDGGQSGPPPKLRGWKEIVAYLAQPASTVQRWAQQGMPVRREGRNVVVDPAELNAWLGREAHAPAPVKIPTPSEDLVADLRQGLMAVKHRKRRT